MAETAPIRYSDDLEVPLPDEDAVVDEVIELMRELMTLTFERGRHAFSGTHAKTHGVVTGTLTVADELEPELAQGLFATPGTHDVVIRYASEPGQVDPDTLPRARGLSLKVLDVAGEHLRPDWTSQDFLFNTWPTIPQGDAKTFRDLQRARVKHFGNDVATSLSHALRHPTPKQSLFDRTPNIHPVAHTYYSQGAFRHGDYVAKLAIVPTSPRQLAEVKHEVDKDDPPGVLHDWVRDFYAANAARYELRVQLCTDVDKMPIEDAAVEWDESVSPYRTVAVIDVPSQETFSPARRVYAEEVMSWRPWYGLAAHRPLGSINRLRRRSYEALGAFRRETNAVDAERDPRRLSEIPA